MEESDLTENSQATDLTLPLYQRIFVWASYFLFGVVTLGSLFDALSNAVSVVTPIVTYIASPVILVGWIGVTIWLRVKPVSWVVKGNRIRIRRLGTKTHLALLGMLVLLWFPRVTSLFTQPTDNEKQQVVNYWGDYLYNGDRITGIHLYIQNGGDEPFRELYLAVTAITDRVQLKNMKRTDVLMLPVTDFEFKAEGRTVFVHFQRLIRPAETVEVFLTGMAMEHNSDTLDLDIDIHTEFGGADQLRPFKKRDF